MTPKARELLKKLKPGELYSMSGMGDLIFDNNQHHSRQTIALKAGRFARQLLDRKFIEYASNGKAGFYKLTNAGIDKQKEVNLETTFSCCIKSLSTKKPRHI